MTDLPRPPSNADLMTLFHRNRRLNIETAPMPVHFDPKTGLYSREAPCKMTPGTRADGLPMGWDLYSSFERATWYRQNEREQAKREGRYPR